jgi:hypothetical protein
MVICVMFSVLSHESRNSKMLRISLIDLRLVPEICVT